MSQINKDFLFELLKVAAPSGQERRSADVWQKEAKTFARVTEDHYGNSYAEIGPENAPAITLMGHLDEIGLIVSHVGEHGFISILGVGGWDPQVLVGQRIRFLAPGGDVIGVIGKKPIHVMDPEDRKHASKMEDLWVDIGLDKEEAEKKVPVGTFAVIEQGPLEVGNCIVSRAIDNRIGAFIVLEALKQLKDKNLKHRIVAVGTSQEEIGLMGAQISAYKLDPIAGVAVDVTHETKQNGVSEKRYGASPFGSGAMIAVGPMSSPAITKGLVEAAKKRDIPYTLGATARSTSTDADALTMVRAGVPSCVVSIPNRYMHSPSEMIDQRDVQACIDVIVGWIEDLDENPNFIR